MMATWSAAAAVTVLPRVPAWRSLNLLWNPRLVAKPSSSVRVRSPIGSGSVFADEMLLAF
jgi:hypothetical protein